MKNVLFLIKTLLSRGKENQSFIGATWVVALLKDNGRIVFHVAVDQQGWRDESNWVSDKSIKGRLKLKCGLNCFNRNGESIVRMLGEQGFSSVCLQPIESLGFEDFDDICKQHLVTAVKSARPNDTQAVGND